MWLELRAAFDEDVFEIASWSGERTEAEKMVFAIRAVRHGVNINTMDRFQVPANLKTFVDLLEDIVVRCVDRIPKNATKKDIRRAVAAAIVDLGLVPRDKSRRKSR